jgi:hypothetical protein
MLAKRGKVMMYLSRVVSLALLISTSVMAQTKVYVCWEEQTVPFVKNNPFPQHVPFRELVVRQSTIELIQRNGIDLTRIVPPREFSVGYRTEANGSEINLLAPLCWKSRRCQIADRDSTGSRQFH